MMSLCLALKPQTSKLMKMKSLMKQKRREALKNYGKRLSPQIIEKNLRRKKGRRNWQKCTWVQDRGKLYLKLRIRMVTRNENILEEVKMRKIYPLNLLMIRMIMMAKRLLQRRERKELPSRGGLIMKSEGLSSLTKSFLCHLPE